MDNRKILEEIKQQKRQLMLKNPPTAASTSATPAPSPAGVMQREAAMRACQKSSASILYVESVFKNSALPVVPRLPPTD